MMTSAERDIHATMAATTTIAAQLRHAWTECTMRGLYQAAKWSGDQLNGLAQHEEQQHNQMNVMDVQAAAGASQEYCWDSRMTLRQRDNYLMALSFFNLREFEQASHTLQNQTHPTSTFLRLYAKYLIFDRKLTVEKRLKQESKKSSASELGTILAELSTLDEEDALNDGFLLYLAGIICSNLKLYPRAMAYLQRSIKAYLYNWSAWTELASVTQSVNTNSQSWLESAPSCLPREIYPIIDLETSPKEEMSARIEKLLIYIPNSTYINLQNALLLYTHNEYRESEALFEQIYAEHPFMLDHVGEYANILYVLENRARLSDMAQRCNNIDKYRPETSCVIGNYYSSRGDHEKGIIYFKRATQLDHSNSLAWTLLGHEYLELKNKHAAVEAYRTAVDINKKDYRAWFALGNLYKLLRLPYYSLYYFQRAAALRPFDPRFWNALGDCYHSLSRYAESIRCYTRSLSNVGMNTSVWGEPERQAAVQIARLHLHHGSSNETEREENIMQYYRLVFESFSQADETLHSSFIEAALYLGRHELKRGNMLAALQYTSRVADSEDGAALLREIRASMKT